MSNPEIETLESPCRLICRLDLNSGLCLGCGRSRGEIAGWTSFTDKERREIMDDLPGRMPPLEAKYAKLKADGKV